MKKDVLISINGMQFTEDGEDGVEVITAGEYFFKNGKHYIMYEEFLEDKSVPVKNTIKIGNGIVEVTKKGITSAKMTFEKDKKNMSFYETEVGTLMLGFNAKNIHIIEKEDDIGVKIEYALEMNNEHVSDCVLKMSVKSKETVSDLGLS